MASRLSHRNRAERRIPRHPRERYSLPRYHPSVNRTRTDKERDSLHYEYYLLCRKLFLYEHQVAKGERPPQSDKVLERRKERLRQNFEAEDGYDFSGAEQIAQYYTSYSLSVARPSIDPSLFYEAVVNSKIPSYYQDKYSSPADVVRVMTSELKRS